MKLTNIVGLLSGLALACVSASTFAATAQGAQTPDAQTQDAPKPHQTHKKHHHHKHHGHKHHHAHKHHHVHAMHENDYGFDGFYVGASVGESITNVTQDQRSLADFNNPNNFGISGPIALKTDNAFKGAFFVGYGQCWDSLYLGAEAFVDLSQYKNRNSAESLIYQGFPRKNQINTHSTLSSLQYGIDLRPGVILTPQSMLYGRVGVAFSDLTLNTEAQFRNSNIQGVNLPLSEEKDVAALRLGAGLEQHLCPRLNLRLDYIYSYYGRISAGAAIRGPGTLTLESDTNIKVYNNTFMLGMSYLIK